MANKKTSDYTALPGGLINNTWLYDIADPGSINYKGTHLEVRSEMQKGITGGKTIEGGTAASENLVLDSTSNGTKGEVQVAAGNDLVINETVITDNISELTADNGIGITVSGNSGAFYDYPTPHNTWFTFSATGTPDDGTNIYIPYSSSDDWWFGFGAGATDLFRFGSTGNEASISGNGIITGQSLNVDPIAAPITAVDGSQYYDSVANEFKFRENGVWHSLGATSIWQRVVTTISPLNAGDNLDLTGGTLYGNNAVSGNLVLDSTSNATKGDVQIANGSTLSSLTTNYETLVLADNDIPNKKYVNDHSVNGIWTRTGTVITVTNAGDDLDLSTAGIRIDSVAAVFDVVAATGITPVNDMVIPVQSSTAGDTNITANPQIVAGTAGQTLALIGADDTKTVTLDDGDGLALDNGQSFTLGQNDIIEFYFYNSLWIERNRKDN